MRGDDCGAARRELETLSVGSDESAPQSGGQRLLEIVHPLARLEPPTGSLGGAFDAKRGARVRIAELDHVRGEARPDLRHVLGDALRREQLDGGCRTGGTYEERKQEAGDGGRRHGFLREILKLK